MRVVWVGLAIALAGCSKTPDVDKATIPVSGLSFNYAVTTTEAGGKPEETRRTVTYTNRDGKLTSVTTVAGSTYHYVQELDPKDPIFVYKHSETRSDSGDDDASRRGLLDTDIESDTAFPMYANSTFKIKFKTSLRMDSKQPTPQVTSLEKSCDIGTKEKLHVPAGTYDVLPIKCSVSGSEYADTTVDYFYAPELGVSVQTETHTHFKKEGTSFKDKVEISILQGTG